jgi:ribose transport system ATP-binding protein
MTVSSADLNPQAAGSGTSEPLGVADHAAAEIVNLSKTFPGTKALDGVSMTLKRGEVHGLVGQNGSGKSTLIKVLAGYYEPDPGAEIYVAGQPVTARHGFSPSEYNMRFVHQGLGLIDEFNAVDNIALAGGYVTSKRGRIRWRSQADRARDLLATVGVDLDVWRPVGEFEAVERTAVAIARALASGRPGSGLLVLDEPSVALSPHEIDRLLSIVRGVADTGVAVLYVSHYLDEVLQIAKQVTVLRNGKLVTTRDVAGLDKRELIRLMIGGEIQSGRPELSGHSGSGAAGDTAEPVMSVSNLNGRELRDLSFDLYRGEVLGVAGALGSGRTELPLALAGAARPCSGGILVGGHAPSRRSPRSMRDLGLVLVPGDRHRQGSIAEFTVSENTTLARLEAFRRRGRLRHSLERSYTTEWISQLDVRPPYPDSAFSSLSGGNQQKVVLGKWLGTEPTILVLDEPTSGVDVGARATIYDIVRAQAAAGLGVVVCSSDTAELIELSDRVIVLRAGKIAAELPGAALDEASILHAMEGQGDAFGSGTRAEE